MKRLGFIAGPFHIMENLEFFYRGRYKHRSKDTDYDKKCLYVMSKTVVYSSLIE